MAVDDLLAHYHVEIYDRRDDYSPTEEENEEFKEVLRNVMVLCREQLYLHLRHTKLGRNGIVSIEDGLL